MSLLERFDDWLAPGPREDEEREIPDPPEDEEKSRRETFDVYHTTVEYRNGDTETFESYGRESTGADLVKYKVDVDTYGWEDWVRFTHDTRAFNYEVLAREPEDERVGEETWEITWTQTWRKRTWVDGRFKEWTEEVEDVELERVVETDRNP